VVVARELLKELEHMQLTVRPTATGEKRRTSVNNLARPRVGANVRHEAFSSGQSVP